jgi:methyl-accepting chemotaxis protein
MIDKLQQGVKAAVTSVQNGAGKVEKNVELAEKTQAMFDSIQALTAEINDRAIQIAAATEEQTNVSEEISNNLVTLNDQNIRNLELANNVQEVANTANRLSTELKASVDHFKVN